MKTQQQIAKQIENLSRNNPNATARQELTNNLQQSVNNLKQQLSLGDKKFVPAELMANALSDMLKQHGKLKLVKLETLPVTPFGGIDRARCLDVSAQHGHDPARRLISVL